MLKSSSDYEHVWSRNQILCCPNTRLIFYMGYKVALTKGIYRWRHDNVLHKLADVLEVESKRGLLSGVNKDRFNLYDRVRQQQMQVRQDGLHCKTEGMHGSSK